MPYIKQEDRKKFDADLEKLGAAIDAEGELNYCITRLCHAYIEKHGLRYHNIARISGVLSNVESEFYRRVATPYEDLKISESGDILPRNFVEWALENQKKHDEQVKALPGRLLDEMFGGMFGKK